MFVLFIYTDFYMSCLSNSSEAMFEWKVRSSAHFSDFLNHIGNVFYSQYMCFWTLIQFKKKTTTADLIESGRTTYSLVVCTFDMHFFSNKDIFFCKIF